MPIPRPVKELLLQSLEHERGGVLLYQTALQCALHPDLRKEWEHYLEQTRSHVAVLIRTCKALDLDAGELTPARAIVRHNGKGLVIAMKMALAAGDPQTAQLIACECIVLAETKDHFDWELIRQCAKSLSGREAALLREACEHVESEEDEHLYHTKGWCRELWIQALGMKAVLPPPEETLEVKSASAAARVEKQRKA